METDLCWRLSSGGAPFVAKAKKKGLGLPGEGVYYDTIHYSKLWDRSTRRIILALSKTFHVDVLTDWFGRELPAMVEVSARAFSGPHLMDWRPVAGNRPWVLDWKPAPLGRAALAVQLLNLGSRDGSSRGSLKFRASIETDGHRERGFNIDRTLAIPRAEFSHEMRIKDKPIYRITGTRLYGEVTTKKVTEKKMGYDRSRMHLRSSYGVEHGLYLFGVFICRVRVGMGLKPDGSGRLLVDFK